MMENNNLNEINFSQAESNQIIFQIKNVELIKLTEDGFFWKGNLVENDKEIYDYFKKWLEKVNDGE